MIRNILGTIDTGALAQIGLVAFFVAFTAIVVYALSLTPEDRTAAKSLPLSDSERTATPSQHG